MGFSLEFFGAFLELFSSKPYHNALSLISIIRVCLKWSKNSNIHVKHFECRNLYFFLIAYIFVWPTTNLTGFFLSDSLYQGFPKHAYFHKKTTVIFLAPLYLLIIMKCAIGIDRGKVQKSRRVTTFYGVCSLLWHESLS